jgi:hypothetical protein
MSESVQASSEAKVAERLSDDPDHAGPGDQPSYVAQARMLLRVHYATRKLSAAQARSKVQEVSGVGDRQYRARHEARLLRLVAQAVLDLDREDDLHQWGRALEVGADVPQSVTLYWLYLFRDHYFRMETSAYALQFDLATALSQLREDMLPGGGIWPQRSTGTSSSATCGTGSSVTMAPCGLPLPTKAAKS